MARSKTSEDETPSFPAVVTFRDFQGEVEPSAPVEVASPIPDPEPAKPATPKEN